jgi:uncharacterized protein (TIGR03437 family)
VLTINGSVHEQRSIPVVLQVMSTGGTQPPRLSLNPGAVTFQAVRGGTNPAAARVNVQAIGAASIPFQTTVSVLTGSGWLSATPILGTAPQQVQVNVNTANLTQGTYTGAVVFQPTGGVAALPATLTVLVTVTPTASGSAISSKSPAANDGGTATGVFLDPPAEFTAVQNSPMSIRVQVFGANGLPLDDAAVTVTSSDGNGPIALENTGGGIYAGVFQSLSGGPVALTATVEQDSGSSIFGIGGDLDGNDQAVPVIFRGRVVNSANYLGDGTPVAPGSILTAFGLNLAQSEELATGFPLPRALAGTKVLVGGIEAPLLAVVPGDDADTPDQVVFQLPYELSDLTYAEIVVNNNGVLSAGEGLAIAPSVPAFFTTNQLGKGPAAAYHADYRLITRDDAARAGETIILLATGLGAVNPGGTTGTASSASRITADLQATVAGLPAVVDYAGLMPGFAGVYQLNVRIPEGAGAGDAPLIVVVAGIPSADGVTVPISPR